MKRSLVLLPVLFIAVGARAADHWVSVSGGYSTFNLGDVTRSSTTYRGYDIDDDSMEGGAGLGVAFGTDFDSPWSVALAYRRTSGSANGRSDESELTLDIPLNEVKIVPAYRIVRTDRIRLGLGVGLGVGFVEGTATISRAGRPDLEGDFGSATFLAEGLFSAEYSLARRLDLQLFGGYRHTEFGEFDVMTTPLTRDDSGAPAEFDLSGWSVLLGVKWKLPESETGI